MRNYKGQMSKQNKYSRQEDFGETDSKEETSTKWRKWVLYFGMILANIASGVAIVMACLIYNRLSLLRNTSMERKTLPSNKSFEQTSSGETTTAAGRSKTINTRITIESLQAALMDVQRNNSGLFENVSNLNRTIWMIDYAIRRGYMELDGGWIAPFNGYQYKVTNKSQSWNKSRRICKNMGGDLATHGVQDWETRRKILNAFNSSNGLAIGLTNQGDNGTWKWINGPGPQIFTNSNSLWQNGGPDEGTNQTCGKLGKALYAQSYTCGDPKQAICEKAL